MTRSLTVALVGVDPSVSTAHGAIADNRLKDQLNLDSQVEEVSDELDAQHRAVQVDGEWPTCPAAGGGQRMTVRRRGTTIRTVSYGLHDLRLQRHAIKHRLGDVNVLVLHEKHFLPTARHGVFARAYFLQTVLGLPAGEALEEALKQRHGVTREHLATRPKLLARIEKLNATTAKWGFDATQQEPADRYPLTGVSGRDAKPLFRELDTIVTAKCREVSPELSLLSQVMNESTAPLVVMLAGDEELAFLPGVSADWLKVAQAVVAPRPNVSYVAESLVDLRMSNDTDRIDHIEGFNPHAGQLLWDAIVAQLPTETRRAEPFARGTSLPSRHTAVTAAIVLPLIVILFTLLVGFANTFSAVGVLALIAAMIGLVFLAVRVQPGAKDVPTPDAPPVAPSPAPTPVATPAADKPVEIPDAVAKRSEPVKLNGTAHHTH
ncbi:MAG: hypothetical protein U0871_29450 [Gemmataceae bacterium]